jgi:hypothetical protein
MRCQLVWIRAQLLKTEYTADSWSHLSRQKKILQKLDLSARLNKREFKEKNENPVETQLDALKAIKGN